MLCCHCTRPIARDIYLTCAYVYVPDGTHSYTHLIYMVLQAQSGTTYREVGSTQTSLGVMSPIPWCCCIWSPVLQHRAANKWLQIYKNSFKYEKSFFKYNCNFSLQLNTFMFHLSLLFRDVSVALFLLSVDTKSNEFLKTLSYMRSPPATHMHGRNTSGILFGI